MDRNLMTVDGECSFVVLTLCSHGDHGDFQVMPRRTLSLDLAALKERLAGLGFRAAVDGERLLANVDGCSIMMYDAGRAVLENVRPDSEDAAWSVYSSMVTPEADLHPDAT